MLRTVTAATAAFALLTSCAPESQAPVRVRALVLNSTGQYEPQEVQLTTVTDIVSLEGSVARFIGGARITVDPADPELQRATNDAALTNALLKDDGRPVTASYIEQDGVLWPADFHTWNLVSTYYGLERANTYFRTVGGLTDADFGGATTVYYFPEFTLVEASKEPLRDNALYFPPVHSFMVLPFDQLQMAPLAINAGVLAHEYAHRVFNQKVYGGQSVPAPISVWGATNPSPGANVLKSIDEGLADYHAYASSCEGPSGCNPRVLSTSFADADVAARDLSKPTCMQRVLRDQLYGFSLAQFTGLEYNVGTVLANALFEAGRTTGQHKALQKAVIAAYSDANPNTPGMAQIIQVNLQAQAQPSLGTVLSAIPFHIQDNTLKQVVCNQFVDRVGVARSELINTGACPQATIQGPTSCPNINN